VQAGGVFFPTPFEWSFFSKTTFKNANVMKTFIDRLFVTKLLKNAWQRLFRKRNPPGWDDPFVIY